jgi:hypothetical protein
VKNINLKENQGTINNWGLLDASTWQASTVRYDKKFKGILLPILQFLHHTVKYQLLFRIAVEAA